MTYRKPLWLRLALMFAIAAILSVVTALLVLAGVSLLTPNKADRHWQDIFGVFAVSLWFAFLMIAAALPVAVLPLVLLGRWMGWTRSLAETLRLSVPLGLTWAVLPTMWWIGLEWAWLFLAMVGAANGLIGGYLWWHWIGKYEAQPA